MSKDPQQDLTPTTVQEEMIASGETADSGVGSEYEREPVPKKALLGFKSFIGMYAGEHCAGTELMIGPLFVVHGVSAFDLIFGLLIGNALAVLSWMFLAAPIATRSRMTLYYQLERICGRKLVTLYNLANGIMFCFLAGAMVTVSATAVCEAFNLPMPSLSDIYPTSIPWALAVLGIGAVIAVVAAFGYNVVARFANIAAPWMVLMFLAFGIIGFGQMVQHSDATISSAGELWNFLSNEVWPGGEPADGKVKFTLWHVMFFSWFCNMAMHIGMSDLTVLRYAKKSWYAIASGAGMYVGHFMAWISASILFAHQLQLDPTNDTPLPGPMTFKAVGYAGLLCVIIAGWTTANPTIYRAGLAFQAVIPKSPRFLVTLITGMIAAVAGLFPAFAMKLLDFVAIYGMVLMPMGAVVFVDFWLIKRFKVRDNFALRTGRDFNWAAGLTWFITLGLCLLLVKLEVTQIFFVSLPGWFLAAAMYILFSAIQQRVMSLEGESKETFNKVTASVARAIGWYSLVILILFAILPAAGLVKLDVTKSIVFAMTILWFVFAPLIRDLK